MDKADSNLYLMHPDVTTFRSRPPEKEFAHDLKTASVDCDDSRDNDCRAENEMKKPLFYRNVIDNSYGILSVYLKIIFFCNRKLLSEV